MWVISCSPGSTATSHCSSETNEKLTKYWNAIVRITLNNRYLFNGDFFSFCFFARLAYFVHTTVVVRKVNKITVFVVVVRCYRFEIDIRVISCESIVIDLQRHQCTKSIRGAHPLFLLVLFTFSHEFYAIFYVLWISFVSTFFLLDRF